ncbi:MAG: ABC transporter six-transmembrane domain-containing protein [Ignavibacteriales bacterium]|nr:ABC transporter six-transmembrane domain-containing protein [Ignavibacteriales bacterium]
MNILQFYRRFPIAITAALGLVVIENAAWIVEPGVFGKVIDALIDRASGEAAGTYLTPLFVWIGVFVLNSTAGALRRSVDPRIFLNIFTTIATDISEKGNQQALSISKIAARAELSREFITFFQYRVPEIIEQSITIVGAIIAMMFFDWHIALTCFVIIIPLVAMTRLYTNRVIGLQKDLHDNREEAYNVFSTREPAKVHEYFSTMARAERRIADWGAINFGVIRFFLLGIFLGVLYIAIDLDDFSTGNIYSIIAYVWTFVTSSEYLPELLESWTSLKDISRRIQSSSM